MLLKDNLNKILMNFDMNFTNKGKNILKKVTTDERMIKYQNLFFKTGNLIIDNFDFLKRYVKLYDLLIDLLNEKISTLEVTQEKKWDGRENLGEKIFTVQKSILKNAISLYDKRIDIIDAFINKDIYSEDIKRDVRYKCEESKLEFEESTTKEQKWKDKNIF